MKITVPNLFIAVTSPAATTSGELLTLFLLVEKPRRVRNNLTHSWTFGDPNRVQECKHP